MVMKAEPWALALEHVAAASPAPAVGERPVLVVPTPSGRPFTQATARELARREHVSFACGRYEGIDERVFGWAEERFEVRLVSLGDYVLNGGEVAALAMIEAIGRLVPGVVGNPESLVEESHEDGLLEYPVYTKPSVWRDREVPPCCSRATTARWPRGAAPSRRSGRGTAARTCGARSRRRARTVPSAEPGCGIIDCRSTGRPTCHRGRTSTAGPPGAQQARPDQAHGIRHPDRATRGGQPQTRVPRG